MALYRDEALVVRSYKLGEADKIVVLYGRSKGKTRAVAKGVRRTKSKFGSRLEPGSVLNVQLYEGKNLDIVNQAERVAPLANLRSDLDRYARCSLILEIVDQVTVDSEPNPALFKLTKGALVELDRHLNRLIVPAFVAKVLALDGVQPVVDRCAVCDDSGPLVAFELHLGGTLCHRCRQGQPISEPARQSLAQIFAGRVRHVLDTASPEVRRELETLTSHMLEQHTERKLKSAAVLYQQLQDT